MNKIVQQKLEKKMVKKRKKKIENLEKWSKNG